MYESENPSRASGAANVYPLDGLLVVSIEQAVAAPMCTLRLADAGARVIKIERPEGDTARHYDGAVSGNSAYFTWLNRGKESIVLDLKTTADLALAGRMIAEADILVQNMAPGAAARLRLGSQELVARHSRLIAVDIVGYGQNTSYRDMRAYDMLIQAESGLCAVTGTAETPSKVGVSVADICTGLNAHAAILEALLARRATGRGKVIEIAMFDGLADWMNVPLLHYQHMGKVAPRVGLSHAQIFPYGKFSCLDGDIVIVVQNASEWRRFCLGVLEQPDLLSDPRFADNPSRLNHRRELTEIISADFLRRSLKQVVALLEGNGLPWGRLCSVPDLTTHPALRKVEVRLPDGNICEVAAPPLYQSLPIKAIPALGEHSDSLRREFAES